jgi:hypothetical protein
MRSVRINRPNCEKRGRETGRIFPIAAGVIAAAALLALVLLRRGEATHGGRVGEVAMSSN